MENLDQVLDAPVSSEKRMRTAGFWIRVAAYIIDAIIIYIGAFVGILLIGSLGSSEVSMGFIVAYYIGAIFYFVGMESSDRQATFGKMAVGIKVGDRNGNPISFANAFGRLLAKILSGAILYIGFMMVGWDEKNQGLHDKLANTYVFYA